MNGYSDLFSLEGKVAIVTGGSRALGRAISELFALAGAVVMAVSENQAECTQAVAEFKTLGLPVMMTCCDVTDGGSLTALIAATIDVYGGLDVVVANAGIAGPMSGSTAFAAEDYRRVMAVNLDSLVNLCGLALPHLIDRGGGSLILMSSIAALRGNATLGPYALAKAALAQLARNLAVEHGPRNIRANAIAPGFIRTELSGPLLADPAFMQRRMAMPPLRRPGEAVEVADAALFLASAASSFVTGQTLVVDGGTTITDGN